MRTFGLPARLAARRPVRGSGVAIKVQAIEGFAKEPGLLKRVCFLYEFLMNLPTMSDHASSPPAPAFPLQCRLAVSSGSLSRFDLPAFLLNPNDLPGEYRFQVGRPFL